MLSLLAHKCTQNNINGQISYEFTHNCIYVHTLQMQKKENVYIQKMNLEENNSISCVHFFLEGKTIIWWDFLHGNLTSMCTLYELLCSQS